jgi:hypothetical protein
MKGSGEGSFGREISYSLLDHTSQQLVFQAGYP